MKPEKATRSCGAATASQVLESVIDTSTVSSASVGVNPVVSQSPRTVYLTPKLLRKLDVLARTEAGCPVAVFERDPNKPWAFVGMMCTSFRNVPLKDLQKRGRGSFITEPGATHVNTDLGCIEIANSIIRGTGPCTREIDWDRIPDNEIYDFLMWHEIAHVIYGDIGFRMEYGPFGKFNGEVSNDIDRLICRGQEIRADRWVWDKMFPLIEAPLTGAMDSSDVNRCLSTLEEYEVKFGSKSKTPISISTGPNEYIYFKYLESGIPLIGASMQRITA